ncbi:hypothetical protein GNIT_2429 [Glaciecola nitratireducens FR1064]|uniref:Uncharacterized protein n=1 Tax=Glaciecola nitratireducens (strain JCM 12485 / KCTC 12276 / FR1064) TaxID=1085623 RepID=G4QHZ3_GLANF|nr:hypothetical protein GNIT_2429 [Glaciecola nitratireducens FR1064]
MELNDDDGSGCEQLLNAKNAQAEREPAITFLNCLVIFALDNGEPNVLIIDNICVFDFINAIVTKFKQSIQ